MTTQNRSSSGINALVSGAIFRGVEIKSSKAGRPFASTTIKMRDGDATIWVKVIAFSDHVIAELGRLGDGDHVAVQGSLKIEPYEKDGATRIGLSLIADGVLALRAERKKKPAESPAAPPPQPAAERHAMDRYSRQTADEFGDDVPF